MALWRCVHLCLRGLHLHLPGAAQPSLLSSLCQSLRTCIRATHTDSVLVRSVSQQPH
jgi:hypothetical protein